MSDITRTLSDEINSHKTTSVSVSDAFMSSSVLDGWNLKKSTLAPNLPRFTASPSKGTCNICGSTSKKDKIVCAGCGMSVCIIHCMSSTKSYDDKLCENCSKKNIRQELLHQAEDTILNTQDMIQDENKRKEQLASDNIRYDSTINKLRSQINQLERTGPDRIKELERKLHQEKIKFETQQSMVSTHNTALQEARYAEFETRNKHGDLSAEFRMLNAEYNQYMTQKQEATHKLDNLDSELKTKIPFKQIRNLTCIECFKIIQLKFSNELRRMGIELKRDSLKPGQVFSPNSPPMISNTIPSESVKNDSRSNSSCQNCSLF
jgi:hypothetical protein